MLDLKMKRFTRAREESSKDTAKSFHIHQGYKDDNPRIFWRFRRHAEMNFVKSAEMLISREFSSKRSRMSGMTPDISLQQGRSGISKNISSVPSAG
jgi:hypothetical protein